MGEEPMRDKASLCMLAGDLAVVSLLTGCGQKSQRVQDSLEQPINCATAREEIGDPPEPQGLEERGGRGGAELRPADHDLRRSAHGGGRRQV
jgi:hypothetical protein